VPIRPENRDRHPADWADVRARMLARAEGRCECTGECGDRHPAGRCPECDGAWGLRQRGRVVLTVAHLDHTPENCAPDNLRAMCQRCHLRYDRRHHAATRRARETEGMDPLFDMGGGE